MKHRPDCWLDFVPRGTSPWSESGTLLDLGPSPRRHRSTLRPHQDLESRGTHHRLGYLQPQLPQDLDRPSPCCGLGRLAHDEASAGSQEWGAHFGHGSWRAEGSTHHAVVVPLVCVISGEGTRVTFEHRHPITQIQLHDRPTQESTPARSTVEEHHMGVWTVHGQDQTGNPTAGAQVEPPFARTRHGRAHVGPAMRKVCLDAVRAKMALHLAPSQHRMQYVRWLRWPRAGG